MPRRAHTVIVVVLLMSTLATTAVALQPVTCDAAPQAEEQLTEKEKANQALIDAFVYHGDEGEHSADDLEHEEQEQPDGHATSDEPTADDCH